MQSLIHVSSFDFNVYALNGRSGRDDGGRVANQNDTRLHQLEIVVIVLFDAIANGQFIRYYGLVAGCLCIFKFMHGIDTAFRISCMKLSNENCRHL